MKFDGREPRPLHAARDRADRRAAPAGTCSDGTFGTTAGRRRRSTPDVEAVETHRFPPLQPLHWRNAELDFGSLAALLDSLDARAARALPGAHRRRARPRQPRSCWRAAPRSASAPTSRDGVRLLWEVCQIPDFRKILTDAHLRLLDTVFQHLAEPRAPADRLGRRPDGRASTASTATSTP